MESLCKCINTGSIEELVFRCADQNQFKKLALAINGMPKPLNFLIAHFRKQLSEAVSKVICFIFEENFKTAEQQLLFSRKFQN